MELLRERVGLTGVKKGKRRNDNDDLERAIQERDERERETSVAYSLAPKFEPFWIIIIAVRP